MGDFINSFDGVSMDMIQIALKLGLHPREIEDKSVFNHLKFVTEWAKKNENDQIDLNGVVALAMAKLGTNANLDSLWLKIKMEEDYDELLKMVQPRKEETKPLPEWIQPETPIVKQEARNELKPVE